MRGFTTFPSDTYSMKLAILLGALSCFSLSALADEAAIRRALEGKVGAPIEQVVKTAYPGLYEVVFNKQIAYTNEDGSFLLVGNLVDVNSGRNLTQQRLRNLTAISFAALPLDLAIKSVHGRGTRTLAVFSDPLCPFCQKLELELAKLKDVTIYTFLTPFEQQHPGASAKSRAIWCAPDRAQAWQAFMVKAVQPAPRKCADPIAKLVELGDKYGFNSTPTLIFADGAVVQRTLTAAQIERLMNESERK